MKLITKYTTALVVLAAATVMIGCTDNGPGENPTYPDATDYVKVLPAGTDGTAGTSATYVEFGEFPQTVLPLNSTVTVDETEFKVMGANTYYLGSDGNYYAKCSEKAFEDDEDLYKYTDGTQVGTGGKTTRYFKVEPIKWRVLTDDYSGRKLLLAENILTSSIPFYYSCEGTRSIGNKTIYPNNYMYSQIRAYINGLDYYDNSNTAVDTYKGKGFLQTAFTEDEQSVIPKTTVDNSLKSITDKSNDYLCDNTYDKIFLLSDNDLFNRETVFFKYSIRNERIRYPTDYALANYTVKVNGGNYGSVWWLRSPFYYGSNFVCRVLYSGNFNYYLSDGPNAGIVPALAISF